MRFMIYLLHLLFWSSFVTRVLRRKFAGRFNPNGAVVAEKSVTAPGSRMLIFLHGIGFFVLYYGIGVFVGAPEPISLYAEFRWVLAGLIILGGGGLLGWTFWVFESWRLRAKIESGHQLTTDGPFRHVRNPIYLAIDLLALGSAIWAPLLFTFLGLALIAIAGDLRARAEEKVLLTAFGDRYREYMKRTYRFIPGIY